MTSAADRTECFLPIAVQAVGTHPPESRAPSNTPADMIGIGAGARDGDLDWWRYLQLWKNVSAGDPSTRQWLGLPLDEEVSISIRRGRVSPRFLRWKAGSFVVVQTPHFEILSRCDDQTSRRVARDVERLYWGWTQMYFPLWAGRDQTAVALGEWEPGKVDVSTFLDSQKLSRLTTSSRHRVVLLADEKSYQLTLGQPTISAGSATTISASEGFYSDKLKTSFFYPQGSSASLSHEVTHQLFEEATDRPRRARSISDTDDFWLVEGIAGHFESFFVGGDRASVGGWDSSRLQHARYQTFIARQPIATVADLQGKRDVIQRRANLAAWYGQAILRVHFEMDSGSRSRRAAVIRQLAAIYSVNVSKFPSLRKGESNGSELDRIDRFLLVDDECLIANPIRPNATALCLAGCSISNEGWAMIPSLPNVTWFDASRTPIEDDDLVRILGDAKDLEQLSLEATQITPDVGKTIASKLQLRELDLSWTKLDDLTIQSLRGCVQLETLWLTGTAISDQVIETLVELPRLKTIDVQRTKITDQGIDRFKMAFPGVELNPLKLE